MNNSDYSLPPLCQCPDHKKWPRRLLTTLLLDCWIRDHKKRPYNTLALHGKLFRRKFYRHFETDDFEVLEEFLKSRVELTSFEFVYMPLPDAWAERIILCLSHMSAVSLCWIDLPAKALEVMTSTAAHCTWESLRLSGNSFTEGHSVFMRDFLLKCRTLQHLDVGYCHLDEIKLSMVADGIVNCSTIKSIDISQIVPIQQKATIESYKVALLSAILISRNGLCEIRLRHCNLTCHDMTPIAEYIGGRSPLTFLDVGSNRIGPLGVNILFDAIVGSLHLIGLNLCCNQIRSEGGETIAHQLPFTRIKFLDIAHNHISAEIMAFILKTMKKSHSMRVLNVTGNELDEEAATVLDRHREAELPYIATCDCTVTYNEDDFVFRVIPSFSEHKSNFNERYHRVSSYIHRFNVAPYYSSCTKSDGRLPSLKCVLIDPIIER